ncbi:MFS transporter [Kitasatospora sp. GP82]|uniref:MFS transporter n=1 Tax=Kitasatospora sp. GP82 TaxID=3035089 RepID=UPI0024746BA0|nr:MFS transporter [Kitasatospora sp. GP82]MDH6128163.1 MFS family permease [Kitasatospora sp. GP82]
MTTDSTVVPAPSGGREAAARARVWLTAWPVTAVFILSNVPTPLLVVWRHRLGFSTGTLTVVFAAYIVGLLAALAVAGVASDRIGRRPVLIPALLLAAVACVIYATAASVAALLAARVLTGLAVGAMVSAGMAAVSETAGPTQKRFAALVGSVAMVVGVGTGPLLSGLVSELLPWPTVTVFLIELAFLVSALAVVLRLPRRSTGPAAELPWVRLPSVPRANRPHLLLGLAVFAPGMTGTSFVLAMGPSLLAGLLGTTDRIVAGATAFVMFWTGAAVQFAMRRGRVRTVLVTAGVCTAAGMAATVVAVLASSVVSLFAAALLAGAGQGMSQLGGLSLLGSGVAAGRLAEANAALNVGGYLPAGVLPVIVGYLSDGIGMTTSTTLFGVVMVTAAVIGAVSVANSRHRALTATHS